MNEEVTGISFGAAIEAVGHVERRQLLLALLNGHSGGDRLVDLDRFEPGVPDESLQLSMHHVHLPKLEGLGLVDVDRQQRSVTAGPNFGEIQPLLELLADNRSQLPAGML